MDPPRRQNRVGNSSCKAHAPPPSWSRPLQSWEGMGDSGLQTSGCHLTRDDQRRETPGQEPNLVPNPPWDLLRTSDHFQGAPASPQPRPPRFLSQTAHAWCSGGMLISLYMWVNIAGAEAGPLGLSPSL